MADNKTVAKESIYQIEDTVSRIKSISKVGELYGLNEDSGINETIVIDLFTVLGDLSRKVQKQLLELHEVIDGIGTWSIEPPIEDSNKSLKAKK